MSVFCFDGSLTVFSLVDPITCFHDIIFIVSYFKAFVDFFSRALHAEYKSKGITIQVGAWYDWGCIRDQCLR